MVSDTQLSTFLADLYLARDVEAYQAEKEASKTPRTVKMGESVRLLELEAGETLFLPTVSAREKAVVGMFVCDSD